MATNDYWTLDLDHLGMKGAGEELARLVLTCQPPYAICVQGKWGSGKTSLMRYAMARLGGEPLGTTVKTSREPARELPDWLNDQWKAVAHDSDHFIQETFSLQIENPDRRDMLKPHIVPIWFNPWQHQDADMPLVALLQELRSQFTFLVQFSQFTQKFVPMAVEAGLTILGELADTFAVLQGIPKTGLSQTGANILKVVRDHRRYDFEERHDAQRLNLMFEQAVERLLDAEKGNEEAPFLRGGRPVTQRRLIIFIDDLDRCSELQAVKLLEAIKLYLQTRNCIFVVGMDGSAARRAVSTVLSHKSTEESQEYLEKLFQTTLHVPVPGDYRRFLKTLLDDAAFDQEQTGLTTDDLAERIIKLVEPNPRKLKNFVNTLAVSWSICKSCQTPQVPFPLFLLLAFLRNYHPEVHRLLAYDPSLVRDLHSVLTEGVAKSPPRSSPVYLFFRRTFRHAFTEAFPEQFEPTRKDEDEVVAELISRLDRHKGDRALLTFWRGDFRDKNVEEVEQIVTAALRADQGMIPEA